jgi:hypothetical protein
MVIAMVIMHQLIHHYYLVPRRPHQGMALPPVAVVVVDCIRRYRRQHQHRQHHLIQRMILH